ncbi:MAG: outer membrane protein [Gammaproteobacteria bacterium]
MKKTTLTLLITSLLFSTTTCFAYAKHHRARYYKGDYGRTYKGEIPYKRKRVVCPPPQRCGLRDGLYVGIDGGYDSYKIKAGLYPPPGSVVSGLSANPKVNATGFLGGLYAGYGHYFDIFYIGAEIFGNYSSATTSYSLIAPTGVRVVPAGGGGGPLGPGAGPGAGAGAGAGPVAASATLIRTGSPTYNVRLTARGAFGGGLLPGIKVNDNTLIYGRADYSRTNLVANENANAPGVGHAIVNTEQWVAGFRYGVGIETQIYGPLSIRGEYTHTSYGSFKSTLSRFTPANNEFMLGLSYHLC